MLKGNKINIGLFILLLLLGAITFYYVSQTKSLTITTLKASDVISIKIATNDKPTILIQKSGESWSIQKNSLNLSLDPSSIQNLLVLTEADSIHQFKVNKDELTKYGLHSPRLIATVNEINMQFGDLDPLNNLRYVLIDNTVHVIKDDFYKHLLNADKLINES